MIRIQGGRFKGRLLQQPEALASRPSSARLRESLFSILRDRLHGAWADLFCGVGGFGAEALGRGVEHCTFVDVERAALRALAANLETLAVDPSQYRIRRADARRWLARIQDDPTRRFQGIFADPPYGPRDPRILLPMGWRLVESGRLDVFVMEHAAGAELPEFENSAALSVRTRAHGAAAFTIIEGELR